MKESRTPNYGLDAPVAVRNMLLLAMPADAVSH
jgi:hypothetical protein